MIDINHDVNELITEMSRAKREIYAFNSYMNELQTNADSTNSKEIVDLMIARLPQLCENVALIGSIMQDFMQIIKDGILSIKSDMSLDNMQMSMLSDELHNHIRKSIQTFGIIGGNNGNADDISGRQDKTPASDSRESQEEVP